MFRMSKYSVAHMHLRQWLLVCLGVCLCLSLAPCADQDCDGLQDYSEKDELLLSAASSYAAACTLLLELPGPEQPALRRASTSPIPRPPTS